MDAAMWQAGSLNGMTWQKAQPATAFIVLAAAAALLMGKRLQLLEWAMTRRAHWALTPKAAGCG